jgi:hypothetical protein
VGLDVQAVRFLLTARHRGVSFAKTLCVGRQELFIDPGTLQDLLQSFGLAQQEGEARQMLAAATGYAEPLLRRMGAEQITSMDASPYEGASVVHDLNLPVPGDLRASYSVVLDAGTLEHVFNFPVALRNCMEMVQQGGHLLLITPANNFMGHGFYQFSPELFFRVCTDSNGFEMVRAIVCEVDPAGRWYEVVDPARARRRVELVTSKPTYLLIQARRVRQVPVLSDAPQQSDYTALWQASGAETASRPDVAGRPLTTRVLRGITRRLKAAYRTVEPAGLVARRTRPDRELFTEVSWMPAPDTGK